MKKTLLKLFHDLNNNNISYCIWGGYNNLPDKLTGSDIDIIVDRIDNRLKNILYANGFIVAKKSIYGGTPIVFIKYIDNHWIPLHIITPIMPSGHIISPKNFFKYCIIDNNMKVVSKELETIIIFAHSIYKKKITRKRISRINNNIQSDNFNIEIFKKMFFELFNNEVSFFNLLINKNVNQIFGNKYYLNKLNSKILLIRNKRSFFIKLKNFISNLNNKIRNRGKIIAVTGIDGAGKTTFIEKYSNPNIKPHLFVKRSMSTAYLPKFFTQPIRKLILTTSRKQTILSKILLLFLHFLQLFCDYFAMYYNLISAYLFAVRTGKHIIFDRYSIDHVNKRVNSKKIFYVFSKTLYILLFPKPDLFIYFDISPVEALKRKQEDSVNILEKKYNSFDNLIKKYQLSPYFVRINAELSAKEVENQILTKIWKFLLHE